MPVESVSVRPNVGPYASEEPEEDNDSRSSEADEECQFCGGELRSARRWSLSPTYQGLSGVLNLYERLFESDSKDVAFKLKDGVEYAHKIILEASSDALKGMFAAEMREGQEHVIELAEVDCVTMRVFLRLLYTGYVDPKDWQSKLVSADYKPEATVSQHEPMRHSKCLAEHPQSQCSSGSQGVEGMQRVPVMTLLSVAVLSKKYMVDHVLAMTTQTLILRLRESLKPESGEEGLWSFNEIMATAISSDLGAVRMAGLSAAGDAPKFRKGKSALRNKFEANELHPQVLYELQAIWPPSVKRSTRVKLS